MPPPPERGRNRGDRAPNPLRPRLSLSREAVAQRRDSASRGRANCAADHITVVGDALEQLPRDVVADADIVVRCDSAGATHELLDFCRDGRLGFSVGVDLTKAVRDAILALDERAWRPAIDADGHARDNGHVAEITDLLDLSSWPAGARVVVRRERPHPGAQLSFTDADGYRFQA